jgi:TonB family protein
MEVTMNAWSLRILGLMLLCGHATAQTWRPERIVGLDYPRSALVRSVEGSVEIECYIANDGTVTRAEPIHGEEELASAAIRNAMRWKFRRTSSGEGGYRLVYHFRIQKVSKTVDFHRFRFRMPGEIFVTTETVFAEGARGDSR